MKIDRVLVQRVEHSGAEFAAQLAHGIAAITPDSGAAAEEFDGGAVVAFGPGRYVNRAIGVGLGGSAAEEVVTAVETFYSERGMPPSLELSPWTDRALIALLGARGYRIDWFRNVYVVALPVATTGRAAAHRIEPLTTTTATARKAVLAGDSPVGSDARRISDELCETATVLHDPHDFVAFVDGEVVACGSLNVADGVGWFGGTATLPAYRGRGLQTALLDHRLRLAHELGCDLAAATALPEGQSARNLERVGFQLLYTQAVLTRPQ